VAELVKQRLAAAALLAKQPKPIPADDAVAEARTALEAALAD
jgi:hypothetical protein